MRRSVARWLMAGLLGAALALGSMAPVWPTDIPSVMADPGGSGGDGG